jgi:hypothetical protein
MATALYRHTAMFSFKKGTVVAQEKSRIFGTKRWAPGSTYPFSTSIDFDRFGYSPP